MGLHENRSDGQEDNHVSRRMTQRNSRAENRKLRTKTSVEAEGEQRRKRRVVAEPWQTRVSWGSVQSQLRC